MLINLSQSIVRLRRIWVHARTHFRFVKCLLPPVQPSIGPAKLAVRGRIVMEQSACGAKLPHNFVRVFLVTGSVVSAEEQRAAVVQRLSFSWMMILKLT